MFKLNEEKMFYDMADGMAVVINFTTGMYYGTSSLGSAVLDRIIAGNPLNRILDALNSLKGCPEDMEARLGAFVQELLQYEIIAMADSSNDECDAIDPKATEEGFELTVDEYAEMQDLIMADPVHDVDVEMGWPVMKEEK